MALSDIEKEKDLKRTKNRPVKAATNLRWSDKQKLEAAKSWLVLGNLSLVSRISGIPHITLRVWAASAWWKELLEDLKVQERMELSHQMQKIVKAAHSVVEDRLQNGDHVVTKQGIVRKPVSMKDAHKVAVDLQNQRTMVDKMNINGVVEGQNEDKLEALANKFAEFATKKIEQQLDKKRTLDVPFVEIVDAVYDEREEGLQAGERAVQLSSGDSPQAVGTDNGEAGS